MESLEKSKRNKCWMNEEDEFEALRFVQRSEAFLDWGWWVQHDEWVSWSYEIFQLKADCENEKNEFRIWDFSLRKKMRGASRWWVHSDYIGDDFCYAFPNLVRSFSNSVRISVNLLFPSKILLDFASHPVSIWSLHSISIGYVSFEFLRLLEVRWLEAANS